MIQLTTPIPYVNPDGVEMAGIPTITHVRLSNMKFEVPRSVMDKPIYIELWCSYIYQDSGDNWEPEMIGLYWKLEEADAYSLVNANMEGTKMSSIVKTIEAWLIANAYIDGTWVAG